MRRVCPVSSDLCLELWKIAWNLEFTFTPVSYQPKRQGFNNNENPPNISIWLLYMAFQDVSLLQAQGQWIQKMPKRWPLNLCFFKACQNSSGLVVPSWQRKIPKGDATLKYLEVLTCLDHTGEGRLVMSDETRTLHWGRQRRLGLVEVLSSFLSHREGSIYVWFGINIRGKQCL